VYFFAKQPHQNNGHSNHPLSVPNFAQLPKSEVRWCSHSQEFLMFITYFHPQGNLVVSFVVIEVLAFTL
jgi:hypothetical protein